MNIFVAFFVLLLLLADFTPPAASSIPLIGMNIFVAFFLLLLLLADSTPPAASSVPLIGAYFCLNMILITLSTFLSVIVINLYVRGDKKSKVPKWLKRLMVDGLARILCMRAEVGDQSGPPVPETQTNQEGGHCKKERKKIKAPKMDYNKFQPPVYDFRDGTPSSNRATGGMGSAMAVGGGGGPGTANAGGGGGGGPQQPDYSPLHTQAIESDVKEIKRILRTFINRLNDKDAQGKIAKEWRIVARILDRLFFFMYVCTIVVSLATIFPKGG